MSIQNRWQNGTLISKIGKVHSKIGLDVIFVLAENKNSKTVILIIVFFNMPKFKSVNIK